MTALVVLAVVLVIWKSLGFQASPSLTFPTSTVKEDWWIRHQLSFQARRPPQTEQSTPSSNQPRTPKPNKKRKRIPQTNIEVTEIDFSQGKARMQAQTQKTRKPQAFSEKCESSGSRQDDSTLPATR